MSKRDGLLKIAMKSRKTPVEFFTCYDNNKERMDEILKEVADDSAAVVTKSETKTTDKDTAVAKSTLDESTDALDIVQAELLAAGANPDDRAKFRLQAERRVKVFVHFVSINDMSEHQVKDIIASSAVGKCTSLTLLYDPKLVGESRTALHTHMPPFQEEYALTAVGGFTSCRASVGHVAAGDQILILDGAKRGLNNASIPRVFQDETNAKVKTNLHTQVTLIYSQQHLTARRRAAKTMELPRQIETLNIFTCRLVAPPFRNRLHYRVAGIEQRSSHLKGNRRTHLPGGTTNAFRQSEMQRWRRCVAHPCWRSLRSTAMLKPTDLSLPDLQNKITYNSGRPGNEYKCSNRLLK